MSAGGVNENTVLPEQQLDFRAELTETNTGLLVAAAPVISVFFLAWAAFDWFIAPHIWRELLAARAFVVVVNAIVVVWTSKSRSPSRGEIGFWLWLFVWSLGISAMLPFVGEGFEAYVVGLSIALVGAGILPYWGFRWSISSVLTCASAACLGAFFAEPSSGELLTFVFVLLTTSTVSVVGSVFRIHLKRREFEARSESENLRRTELERSAELREALDQLAELDRVKSEFFANISHELRTPLTLILSPVDELLTRLRPGAERNGLKVVRRNATRLLRMIDDLLDLARLEAGGLRLKIMQVDVAALAKRVTENAEPAARGKQIELTFSSVGDPPEMFGDPHRLEIILTNLVGNAMKFTPAGGSIEVRTFHNPAGASIEVSDTGPGIPRNEQHKIFERFHQTETSERRQQGGVGIGLALARELAQLHGGSLTVESEVGRGSTFTLFLKTGKDHFHTEIVERRQMQFDNHPRRRVEDRVSGQHPQVGEETLEIRQSQRPPERVLLDRGRAPRVLVAEDEDDLRGFITGVLSESYHVDAAKDGEAALALIKQRRPDLVLTDVMMPGTSGLDLCRAIKDNVSLQHIPVILLTARGESETALEGYEAGADDFVSKPFHTQVLLARIRAHLKMRGLSLQLADQARLASAGTLAAGLAHEVKNPLNAVVNAAKVLEQGGSQRVPSETLLGVIIDGIHRIDGIVSALGAHARPADGTDLAPCNVRVAVESTLNLLHHKMRNVAIHEDYEVTGDVFVPARAFNQVLLNLIDNSVRSDAENIWIELRQREKVVSVTVADDGPGIPDDMVHRIFDPFFTTRAEGEGTGLGLHLSRRIAHESGGELRYEPRPGGGARFVMEIPAMEQAA